MKLTMAPHQVVPERSYPNLGILSFARGVFGKPPIEGTRTSAATLYAVKAGQFIYSRLFAFEGAYTVIPAEFDGYFVSNEFPTFDPDPDAVLTGYLRWLFACPWVWAELAVGSTGMGDRRQRIHPERIAEYRAPMPPIDEQRRIVARLDQVERIAQARQASIDAMDNEAEAMLRSAFDSLVDCAPLRPMAEVAPLVRRPVTIDPDQVYTEIGVKSFYKGIFHRRSVTGAEFSWQKLFWVEKGDIIFSNLMAWEQAIAEAFDRDHGCAGNHRMLTCQPIPTVMVSGFLSYFFRTQAGFAEIVKASPGTAARNKTLSPTLLANIPVPTPPFDKQLWFDRLQAKVREMRAVRERAARDAGALLPAMLHEIFCDGEA
ncbi:MAG: restriction endonuclease subunit S [Alphaproteobacteria bacterium]|nr:restriction endonuclease subunit S [Alphaproteobacteria bacterium]